MKMTANLPHVSSNWLRDTVMRRKEARKDRLHQNYLKRKANGKQKEYEERTKAKKKAQIGSQKEQIRAEGRQTGGNVKISFVGKGYDSDVMAFFDVGTKYAVYYRRK